MGDAGVSLGEGAVVAPVARGYVFEGLVNFRDLGGIAADGGTMRPGRLFRSDSLNYATEADAARLVEAGLATIVDLRDTV